MFHFKQDVLCEAWCEVLNGAVWLFRERADDFQDQYFAQNDFGAILCFKLTYSVTYCGRFLC